MKSVIAFWCENANISLGIGIGIFSLLAFFLRERKEPKRRMAGCIPQVEDPKTRRPRTRILDGTFDKGVHDQYFNTMKPAIDSNVVFIESRVPLDKHVLIEALLAVARIHPLLRVKFEWEPSKETGKTLRYFTEMERLTSNELIYTEVNQESREWKRMLEDELLQGFDVSSGPLWRVSRLNEAYDSSLHLYTNTILFTFHHSICDGTSIMNFYDQLLDVMDQMFHGVFTADALPTFPLVEPVNNLVSHHIELSWWKALLFKTRSTLESFLVSHDQHFFSTKFPPPKRRDATLQEKTHIALHSLSKEETSTLMTNCKTNKCTVGGALAASVAVAWGEMLRNDDGNPSEFQVKVLVNIRNGCKPKIDTKQFGFFVGEIYVPFSFPSDSTSTENVFWQLAREMSTEIKAKIAKNEQYENLKSMKYTDTNTTKRNENAMKSLVDRGAYPTVLCLSNRGHFDWIHKQRIFEITRTHCVYQLKILNPFLAISTVTVNGKLNLSLMYLDVLNQELSKGFWEMTVESLKKAASRCWSK